jgi:transposase InsO family protein
VAVSATQVASRVWLPSRPTTTIASMSPGSSPSGWPSRAAAKLAVGDWIERVYNRRRRHSALSMIGPSKAKTD